MVKPLCIDLYAGLGGWAEGFLAAGYDVVGFDNHRHVYGEQKYPGQLVIQDVLTLHGSQFRNAAVIVASPPCQEFSYMAMPWSLAKAKAARIRADETGTLRRKLTALFDACFRIQREACEAAGRYIPLIVENVKGAQPWVGRSPWNFGSFYLWGDVPALMPIARHRKGIGGNAAGAPKGTGATSWFFGVRADPRDMRLNEDGEWTRLGLKNSGGSWFAIGSPGQKELGRNPVHEGTRIGRDDGTKQGGNWWHDPQSITRKHSSRSSARKMASAQIAKIPFALAEHIARVYKPAYEVATPRDAATLARDDAPNQTTGAYPAA